MTWKILYDPQIIFLRNQSNAHWIKYDSGFQLNINPAGKTSAAFGLRFKIPQEIKKARLEIRALKYCKVFLDRKVIYSSPKDFNTWKQTRHITIPSPLHPGNHQLLAIVVSENTPPALLVYSDQLPVATGRNWLASLDLKEWTAAAEVSPLRPAAVSRRYPSALNGLLHVLPWLGLLFLAVFLWTLLHRRFTAKSPRQLWLAEAGHLRWAAMLLWLILGINNIPKLPSNIGYDLPQHLDYIKYIASNHALPLATDGWQMFQPPLFYLICAPFYSIFSKAYDPQTVVKMLRIFPLLFGLLQIEIVYRIARLVFPAQNRLRAIAVIAGAMIPMHTYICQVVGNEPLAGLLTSLTILMALRILADKEDKLTAGFFVLTGLIWGLALLSKMTPLLLAFPLLFVLFAYGRKFEKSMKSQLLKTGLVFGTAFVTAGWFYIRNWILLGKPFIGGWDPIIGIPWWQDPGYRTWSQFLSFGQSLKFPFYAGVVSLPDALYSTFWLDGFGLGEIFNLPPWNYHLVAAGAILALVPTLILFAGLASTGFKDLRPAKNQLLFSALCIAIYIAAIIFMYLKLPIYSTAKATYMLGILPCFALLIAAGAQPFFRNKWCEALFMTAFSCWAVAAYAAYFII
ncbi:MAG: glycosyltransferase family 39 protein [Deltaproteobacteria bacterium]